MCSVYSSVTAWPCGVDHLNLHHLLRVESPSLLQHHPLIPMHLNLLGCLFFAGFKKKKKLYQDANLQKYMHDNSLPHFRDHIEDDGSGPDSWKSAVWVLNKDFNHLGLIIFPWKSGVLSVLLGTVWCAWHWRGNKIPTEKRDWFVSLPTCRKCTGSVLSPVGQARTSIRNVTPKNNLVSRNTEKWPFLSAKKNRL